MTVSSWIDQVPSLNCKLLCSYFVSNVEHRAILHTLNLDLIYVDLYNGDKLDGFCPFPGANINWKVHVTSHFCALGNNPWRFVIHVEIVLRPISKCSLHEIFATERLVGWFPVSSLFFVIECIPFSCENSEMYWLVFLGNRNEASSSLFPDAWTGSVDLAAYRMKRKQAAQDRKRDRARIAEGKIKFVVCEVSALGSGGRCTRLGQTCTRCRCIYCSPVQARRTYECPCQNDAPCPLGMVKCVLTPGHQRIIDNYW